MILGARKNSGFMHDIKGNKLTLSHSTTMTTGVAVPTFGRGLSSFMLPHRVPDLTASIGTLRFVVVFPLGHVSFSSKDEEIVACSS